MSKLGDVLFDNHIMLECKKCGFRIPLHSKNLQQVKHMFCGGCDTERTFERDFWTPEEKHDWERKREDDRSSSV